MLAGALEALGLPQCDAVLVCELKRIAIPHRHTAVKAAAGLVGKGVGAATHQRAGHEKLLKSG